MTYYIFIQNEKLNGCRQCRQLTEGVTNLEVDESLYNTYEENPDMYIWDGSEVVVDPDYEEKQAQKEKERRNQEIDEKIKELQIMALPEVLNGNIENIKLYNNVIDGLNKARL